MSTSARCASNLGHVSPADTYRNLSAAPELSVPAADRLHLAVRNRAESPPVLVLQTHFTDRLIGRRAANPNTETIVGTAQFSEATRAKLRNRLRLLMLKLKLIDDECGT
jgi:hypothetical protein